MVKTVKHMSVYFLDIGAPEELPEYEPDCEQFFDADGRKTRERRGNDVFQYQYLMGEERLYRLVQDFNDGHREVTEYQYADWEWDDTPIHCHWEKLERKEKQHLNGTPYEYEPIGEFSDEWYDWHNNGKTCVRTKTSQKYRRVTKEIRTEEYNDLGWLRKVHHTEEDSGYESTDYLYHSYPDGILQLEVNRTVFLKDNGERRCIHTIKRYYDELPTAIETWGEDTDGKDFHNLTQVVYKFDEEGNWIVSKILAKDKPDLVVMRIIEYW